MRARRDRIGILLLALVLSLGAASSAKAVNCSDPPYFGVIDGNVVPAPAQIQIDTNCTFKNFPQSNPLTTNISFLTQPGQTDDRWLVIFDNVYHTGNMACNSVAGHKIWFVNGSSSAIQEGCQNLLIPVEKIDKETPAGQTTAAIGVPFTYTLTIPVLFDPATGNVINSSGSPNDLHSVTVWDDLNDTGVDLTYLSHVAYWRDTGTPVPHTFTNVGGLLTFDNFPIIPAGDQIIIEITVVLEDTPANAPGTQFINTAKWDFGRLIDDVFYEPLPGEWGISPPLTIAAPDLVVTKTGPATLGLTLNLGQYGQFTIDVHNVGLSDAFDVTILDQLPDGATGGMCDFTPEVLSAQVFEADGTTPVSGLLVEGTDFSLSYVGAPTCELTLTMLTAAATIGPDQRLIITYQSKLDADSQDGATLTNFAGATEWFNGDSSNPNRIDFTRPLTNGTPGVPDHEDAHTVTVALFGYFFEKTVANLITGANPASTAAPGDTLRYTLRLQATDVPLTDVSFYDEMGALNAGAVFVPNMLSIFSAPGTADTTNTDPNGGANGAGILDVRNLNVPAGSEIIVQFDMILDPTLADGTVVLNQAELISTTPIAVSDDPNINGQADPSVDGDEDPTQVLIQRMPAPPLVKANTQATAAVGEEFSYQITVPETPQPFPLYDVQILDDLTASAADLRFVSVTKISGSGSWTPVNTGTATNLVIEDPVDGIDIPAGEQIVIEITVVLEDTAVNVVDLSFVNTADYTYNRSDGNDASQLPGAPGTTEPMTIVEPELTLEKSGPAQMILGTPSTFSLDVHNPGGASAWNLTITDQLPDGPSGGTCDAAPTAVTAQVFEADGVTPVSGPLVQGTDFDVSFVGAPTCEFTLTILSAAGTIGPDQRLLVGYQTTLDGDTQNGAMLTNVAGATQWFSAPAASPDRRVYDRILTDGTTDELDHEDAHTVEALTNVPVLFAAKDVSIFTDGNTPNAVDPGDVLLYTITVSNSGGAEATNVVLTDTVPANTTYVPNTVTLNGEPVGQPDGGISPLVAGIPISSSDLTLPLPGPGEGTITPGETAVIEFRVRVDDVPGGTVISNQGVVSSGQLPNLPTDGDGDPATGPEPTVVVVSGGQQLLITKQVSVAGGGPALPGSVLEYVVTVLNVALVPALDVVITDDLDAATPNLITYVDPSATLDGSTTGISFAGSTITADYFTSYGPLQPSESTVLRFRAVIDPNLTPGTTITNIGVVTWNAGQDSASASASIDVGGFPGVGVVNGRAWHDADFDDVWDATERPLAGWTATLYLNGAPLQSVVTDASGSYTVPGLAPNDVNGDQYMIRFTAPGAGANTAALGLASSVFTNGLQEITEIVVPSGSNLQDLDLPIDPNGVVYDSIQRTPIAGATLTMLNASGSVLLPTSCFDDTAQQGQVTLADGYYKFDLNFSDDLACPINGSYIIAVAPPGPGYVAGYSQLTPPTTGPADPAFSVPTCPVTPADAVFATADHCEAQLLESAPQGAADTTYHVHLLLNADLIPGSSQIFNNHIPLDPELDGSVAIIKTTPLLNVTRGQLVPYQITFSSELALDPLQIRIVDRYPAGFHYIEGSARIAGVPVEPVDAGGELVWDDVNVAGASNPRTISLLLAVGAGVSEGLYVNRAQAFSNLTGGELTGEATATVRVVPDPTFSCTDAVGKVFDDANRNGVQDPGEPGLPGVRLVTVRGLAAITDRYGRYHVTCAATPNETRGSNFILKLDDRTLPSGYRMSTRQVQVQRATAGKALRLNFAASIHRVVSLDLADAVFVPGSTEMRVQWRPRLDLLIEELKNAPSTLRLSYVADVEDARLVSRRLAAVKDEIIEAWEALDRYELAIESEVFWRRGAPPDRPADWKREGG